eukprot:CAMPEP_0178438690 /NCGR_PEP_ID=MMETSP0689_2-20121128/35732_1 /TAXON_ID=160604 /ORGANISM="Amphidinium massartii, Strain CS-259" /LENGTH=421 /DNA_ID=CAMNT_0020061119 /DNA_START=91 /DNA_END=1356 /DNA_ORIENTATION=-
MLGSSVRAGLASPARGSSSLRQANHRRRSMLAHVLLGLVVALMLRPKSQGGFMGQIAGTLLQRGKEADAVASMGADVASEGLDPTLEQFASPERQELLVEVTDMWNEAIDEVRATYPEIDRDPFFNTDVPGLLRRYLLANGLEPASAVDALRATAQWRKDWDVLSYYAPGAALDLFSESSNPGSEMYFADSLSYDKQGRPYVAGRLRFANAENMHPWRHLRAGVLVFELMANKVARLGRGPASYILDVGSTENRAGNVSGTAGLDRNYDESINPYYNAGAGTSDAPSPAMVEEFGSLDNGFLVLKAAIKILNKHYPGVMGSVYYLNSDMIFWGAFKVFSRWISDRGSIEFRFLGDARWREEPVSSLLDSFDADQLPEEWCGSGPALDGDKFLERALEYYEATAQEESLTKDESRVAEKVAA